MTIQFMTMNMNTSGNSTSVSGNVIPSWAIYVYLAVGIVLLIVMITLLIRGCLMLKRALNNPNSLLAKFWAKDSTYIIKLISSIFSSLINFVGRCLLIHTLWNIFDPWQQFFSILYLILSSEYLLFELYLITLFGNAIVFKTIQWMLSILISFYETAILVMAYDNNLVSLYQIWLIVITICSVYFHLYMIMDWFKSLIYCFCSCCFEEGDSRDYMMEALVITSMPLLILFCVPLYFGQMIYWFGTRKTMRDMVISTTYPEYYYFIYLGSWLLDLIINIIIHIIRLIINKQLQVFFEKVLEAYKLAKEKLQQKVDDNQYQSGVMVINEEMTIYII